MNTSTQQGMIYGYITKLVSTIELRKVKTYDVIEKEKQELVSYLEIYIGFFCFTSIYLLVL